MSPVSNSDSHGTFTQASMSMSNRQFHPSTTLYLIEITSACRVKKPPSSAKLSTSSPRSLKSTFSAHRHDLKMPLQSQSSHSCVACARRKVKCDRLKPCSSCSRSQAACVYRPPVPSQRHRKRLNQRDLLSKIQELESILDTHGIPFDGLGNSWIPSHWEEKLVRSRTQASPDSMSSIETAAAAEAQALPSVGEDSAREVLLELEEQDGAAWLWSELPEIVSSPLPGYVCLLRTPKVENTANFASQTN